MTFNHAQSARLGQRVPPETSSVQVIPTLYDLPEVSYEGQVIYVQDLDVFQVYDGAAWQTPSTANAGYKTFVQVDEPTNPADGINVGDLWLNPDTRQFQTWTGTSWIPFQVVDDTGEMVAAINLAGDAQFRDLTVGGTAYLTLAGISIDGRLLADYFNDKPRGITGGFYAFRNPAVSGITTTDYGLLEATYNTPADVAQRQYRMHYSIPVSMPTNAAYSCVVSVLRTYDGTAPTITSEAVESVRHTIGPAGAASRIEYIRSSFMASPGAANTHYRYLLALRADGGPGTVDVPGFTYLWMEDIGLTRPNVASSNTGGGVLGTGGSETGGTTVAQPVTYTKTYDATNTKWWGGAPNNTFGTSFDQYFGNTSATNDGRRKSAIWFPKSTITTDLTGGTIVKVELYLYLFDGGNNRTVAIGRHTDTTPTNVYGELDNPTLQVMTVPNWDQGTGKWVDVTAYTSLADWLGTIGGYVIGPSSDDTNTYAGGYRGSTHSLHPKLRITYTR